MQAALTSFVAGLTLAGTVTMTALPSEMSGPNPSFTRGAVVSEDRASACAWGHTQRLYDADPAAYKRQARRVFALYGLSWKTHRNYELDHLIPRCIGGADVVGNLWPQPLAEALIKDVDERRICRAVCDERSMAPQEGHRYFVEGKWR